MASSRFLTLINSIIRGRQMLSLEYPVDMKPRYGHGLPPHPGLYKIINQNNIWLNIGGSTAYRHLDNTTLTTIYKPDSLISGDDFRFGFEAQFHWNNFELQGEYIEANINNDKATGYYALVNYSFLKKYQAVALTEKYNDLNPANNDNAWYGLGLNYQISGKTKLMTDFKTRESASKQEYLGEIQLQVFFN